MSTVKILTSERSPFTLTTSASTWGQLKTELSNHINNIDNMTVVLSTTKSTLDLDEAVLPITDYTLYFSQKNIKAGGTDMASVLIALKEKFLSAFDETIDEVIEGEHSDDDSYNGDSRNPFEDPDVAEWNRINRKLQN